MKSGFAAHDDATAVEAFCAAGARCRDTRWQDRRRHDGDRRAGSATRTRLVRAAAVSQQPRGVRIATLDDRAGARPLLEAAMREWHPGSSEDDYELVAIPQSLASVVGEPKRSLELLAQARAVIAHRLGADHPRRRSRSSARRCRFSISNVHAP